jgi:hypothetical protein
MIMQKKVSVLGQLAVMNDAGNKSEEAVKDGGLLGLSKEYTFQWVSQKQKLKYPGLIISIIK